MRKAKILATLGPASNDEKTILSLIKAGVNAVRINMSHGTREEHQKAIENARAAARGIAQPLAILVDLSGPKIRTRGLKGGKPVELVAGSNFTITARDIEGDSTQVATNYNDLPDMLGPGAKVLIDDGAIELVVVSVNGPDMLCRVVVGGYLNERKGINLPNTHLPIPSMTEKDHQDLEWAMAQNVDYIALSFVRRADDCRNVKDRIKALNTRRMGRALLVAKIEKAEAIENLDEIIAETDGVMVARGDLGVETSVEHVPVYQKRIIERAVANDKFVITATQMLQSMIDNPQPTRAEASDVANAVWDGTDAVMLSAETATGSYPVETILTMGRIIDAAETIGPEQLKKPVKFSLPPSGRTSQALCKAAAYAAKEAGTEKVAVFTESGLMARRLSSFRSGLRTFALTTSQNACNQLALIWGVQPFVHEIPWATQEMLKIGERTLLEAGVVENGEQLIMMAGRLSGLGLSSSVIAWTIGEDIPKR
ncbi:MAG TPA: pyruvate kinase [Pyrinomonadaceae bacterium]|nr:pyruvate kinase [Pyrinomonadaceae bacterium]HMP65070.1 pyruvate kinase [Pyrinomonadaceae bacterium]